MRFVCPYCGADTEKIIAKVTLGHGTCKSCKRKYRIVPIAVREEDPAGVQSQKACVVDYWKCIGFGIVVYLSVAGVIALMILGVWKYLSVTRYP